MITAAFRRIRPALVIAGLLLAATPLAAHDFWIVPDALQFASGGSITARTVIGTKFAVSESAVPVDRIADARILGADPAADEPLRGFTVSGKSLVIQHRPASSGERVIALALAPSTRRMSGDAFARYLRLEGAADLADQYARESLNRDSIVMRSAKYAKTLVEVGAAGPRAFGRAAGHAVEFIPLSDPSAAGPGDSLSIRIVADGRPVANAHVHAGRALAEGDVPVPDVSLTADAKGVVRLPIARAGLWNVRTAYLARTPGAAVAPAAWDVWWATFVFYTAGGSMRTTTTAVPAPSSDSTDVVRVVEAFHGGLARGDSVAVLALLAPDAVILESGDVQTFSEYRGHHLAADITFERALPATRTVSAVRVEGNAAWITATSVTQGQYNGRTVNSAGAELMVLARRGPGAAWLIRAIHWSSHRRTS